MLFDDLVLSFKLVDGWMRQQLVAPAVYASVGERYYKVTSEALRVCSAMIGVIRPPNQVLQTAPFLGRRI